MLLAKMESEDLRFQIVDDWERILVAMLIAMGSAFHSFGARREMSLGCVEHWPGVFSEGTTSFPALADLSAQGGL